MSMNRLYGAFEVVPSGGSTPSPMASSVRLLASMVWRSQAPSKTLNILALSVQNIFSAPTASAISPSPERTY